MLRALCWLVFIALTSCSRSVLQKVTSSADTSQMACPVLASLTTAGHFKPDSVGRVSGPVTIKALMATGATSVFAAFQAAGIVGFLKEDINQKLRMAGPRFNNTETKYVNLNTMNPDHQCTKGMRKTKAGHPCNMNTFYQQHAYSTTIMDNSAGKTTKQRFWKWFGASGVLERPCKTCEQELTVKGLGRLLKNARYSGDYSGENSLNKTGGLSKSNMAYFHPSVTKRASYVPLAQWQAQLAWTGFWVAFARDRNGVGYMPLSDLESMFLQRRFPKTWKKRTWGLGTMFNFLPALKGTGAGDEFIRVVEGFMKKVGKDASEETLYKVMLQTLFNFGAFNDAVSYQIE